MISIINNNNATIIKYKGNNNNSILNNIKQLRSKPHSRVRYSEVQRLAQQPHGKVIENVFFPDTIWIKIAYGEKFYLLALECK